MTVDYERCFVEYVVSYLKEQKISHSEFARQLFDLSDDISVRQWRRIRDPKGTGKPRKLSLAEAYRVSEILGIDFPSLIWQVAQHAKQNQT